MSGVWTGDHWDIAANQHLLAHILAKLKVNSQVYGRPASYLAMRKRTPEEAARGQNPNAGASSELIANVAKLVAAKKAWAADMRDLAAKEGEVPLPIQREIWNDYITRAGREISQPTSNTRTGT